MQKITSEEIAELRNHIGNGTLLSEVTIDRVTRTLDRLEELEAAVAWNGFDEAPNYSDSIEFLWGSGKKEDWQVIDDCGFCEETGLFTSKDVSVIIENNNYDGWNEFDEYGEEILLKLGFIGWRYPVGDLSK